MIKRSERYKQKKKLKRRKHLIICSIVAIIIVIIFIVISTIKNTQNETASTTSQNSSSVATENKTNSNDTTSDKEEDNSNKKEDKSEVNLESDNTVPQFDEATNIYYYKTYYVEKSKADKTEQRFWVGYESDHKRPGSPITEAIASKYNAYYIGNNNNTIYLTFNEDSDKTQITRTLSILHNYNIKATFFLSKEFMKANQQTVKMISEEGHYCCNLASSNADILTLAAKDPGAFIKEVVDTEDLFYKITGRKMTKLFRFSDDIYSNVALDYLNKLGYKTLFWSFFYQDFNKDDSSNDEILNLMKSQYHNGAIFLLHDVNSSNPDALDSFLSEMTSKYKFTVPNYLIKDEQKS